MQTQFKQQEIGHENIKIVIPREDLINNKLIGDFDFNQNNDKNKQT